MENPQTWGVAEDVIDGAIKAYVAASADGYAGSEAVQIAKALREAGLLLPDGGVEHIKAQMTEVIEETGVVIDALVIAMTKALDELP